jgi:hypothetical protein
MFDASTQGRTRKEALDMIADWFVTMVRRRGFSVRTFPNSKTEFEIGSGDAGSMVALLLRRQRQRGYSDRVAAIPSDLLGSSVSSAMDARATLSSARHSARTSADDGSCQLNAPASGCRPPS